VLLTDSTEEFDAQGSKDVEEEEEQQSEVADFGQRLHHGVDILSVSRKGPQVVGQRLHHGVDILSVSRKGQQVVRQRGCFMSDID